MGEDTIAIFAYYEVQDQKPSVEELYEMNNQTFLPSFKILGKIVNAKAHNYLDLMPAFCNGDYPAMNLMHAGLIRKHTCANSNTCDYWIVGDQSPYLKEHPRKKDEDGCPVFLVAAKFVRSAWNGRRKCIMRKPVIGIVPLVDTLDGFLFTGGQDVAPALYHERPSEKCGECCVERDDMETALFWSALERDKPILGICRGIQFMNAALGGTLYQDLPTARFVWAVQWHPEFSYETDADSASCLEHIKKGKEMTPEVKKETDRKLENYRQLNQTAQKNQILFVGSSLMEMFPIEEFIKEHNLPLIAYNRGVGGYKTEDLLNALQVCVYDLSSRRIFINIGTNDLSDASISLEQMISNYDQILSDIQSNIPDVELYIMAYYPVNYEAGSKA